MANVNCELTKFFSITLPTFRGASGRPAAVYTTDFKHSKLAINFRHWEFKKLQIDLINVRSPGVGTCLYNAPVIQVRFDPTQETIDGLMNLSQLQFHIFVWFVSIIMSMALALSDNFRVTRPWPWP